MENNTINTIHHLIDYQISQLLSAEVELRNNLPRWINEVSSFQLKTVLQKYIGFINQHIKAIEDFITEEQITMVPSNDPIMLAIISQTDECLSYCKNAEIKDACLLASIQGVNHYKISIYGTVSSFADLLELQKFATILHEADINEKHIDDRLTQLAKYEINVKAKSPISI